MLTVSERPERAMHMPKRIPVTDDENVLAALSAAKSEGAKAMLVEIGLNTITSITVFLDDKYQRLLSDEEAVHYEVDPKTARLKGRDAPH
jgi:hypothetical protein